jgi:glycosyltransferase involved in cell wall biosynthesis
MESRIALPRVMHVTTAHPPLDGRIYYKEVRALADDGVDVCLATTIDRRAQEQGVSLLPLGKRTESRLRRLGRALRALSTMCSHREFLIHIHDPELLLVALVPAMFGVRVIYDVHEFYADTIMERAWIPPSLRPAARACYRAVEGLALRCLSGVVVVVEDMLAHYEPRMPAGRVALVRNYPNISSDTVARAQATAHPLDGRPYVLHTGGRSRRVSYHLLVAAAEHMRELAPDLAFVNIGEDDLIDYPPAQRAELVARARAAGVIDIGRIPYPEVQQWLGHARIGYIPLEDTYNHRIALPNKLFEYLQFGLPIVADRIGRVAEIVSAHDLGMLVPPEGRAHAVALRDVHCEPNLHAHYSRRAREAAHTYSFASELPALRDLYERIYVSSRDASNASSTVRF